MSDVSEEDDLNDAEDDLDEALEEALGLKQAEDNEDVPSTPLTPLIDPTRDATDRMLSKLPTESVNRIRSYLMLVPLGLSSLCSGSEVYLRCWIALLESLGLDSGSIKLGYAC